MDTAFPYSQYVTGKNFVGRRSDVTLLGNLLSQGVHVLLAEPPKTGKTSLVQQTLFSMRMTGKSFTVGQMNVLNLRDRDSFLLRLGATLLRMAGTSSEDYAALTEKYLSGTHFVHDANAYSERGEVLSSSWELDQEDMAALFRLPFALARDRGELLILILDEFQCVRLMEDDGDSILRALDASLKEHADNQLFSYIFAGGGVNSLQDIFLGSARFHRQVERVRLSAVDEREMADHVHKGFLAGGKVVDKDLLLGACRLFRGHLWYINHFASICDAMTRGYLMEPVLVEALGCLVALHEPRFKSTLEGLTTHQVNLLKATVEGVTRLSSAEVIRHYQLNSSANVKRVKDALMKKEILLFDDADNPTIIDPLFEYWVKKYYFEMKD